MEKTNYYKPIIEFLDDLILNHHNSHIVTKVKSENVDEICYDFLDTSNEMANFGVTLWLNSHSFPRLTLKIKKPNSVEFYEVIDEYNGGKDINVDELTKHIKSIISNKFIFRCYYLDDEKYKSDYIYVIYKNGKVKKNTDSYTYKMFVWPWQKRKIIEKINKFEPWLKNEYTL